MGGGVWEELPPQEESSWDLAASTLPVKRATVSQVSLFIIFLPNEFETE